MKKPSERIKELGMENTIINGEYNISQFNPSKAIMSILEYLDEEWEKNKPCEHKDSYTVDSTSEVYYNVCNDCGVLFLGK